MAMLFGVLLFARSGGSAEFALIVGGGNSPTSNPVSLERQVLQAAAILHQRKFASIDILFADGDAPEPDVAEAIPLEKQADRDKNFSAAKNLERIFARGAGERGVDYKLRNHRVPNVLGAATKANLQDWFAKRGSQLQAGDTLLLYFATHGIWAKVENAKPAPQQSELLLWDGGRVNVSELAALVRLLPSGVQVQLLITACYSGGFAELGWPGPAAKTVANFQQLQTPVAGIFATSFDRPAAGCTTAVETPEVRDYATCFWSALAGKWPDGQALKTNIDLNGDGGISFDEAHAFALVSDTTLDTPLTTSDFALRQIGRFGRVEETALLTDDPYYDELRAAASPEARQLLDRLSTRQNLTGQRRLSHARTKLRRISFDLAALVTNRAALVTEESKFQTGLRSRIELALPELAPADGQTKLSPEKLRKFIAQHESKWMKLLADEPLWPQLVACQTKLAAIDAERLQLERRWAGYQRFVQTAESVILAHNLPSVVKDKTVLRRFEALRKAEQHPFEGSR
jgi:hypothetical protein